MRLTSLLLFLVASACMDEKQHDVNTPREVVREFVVASASVDADRMAACTTGDEIDREHMRAFLAMRNANVAFKEKVLATYGADGWATFNDNEHGFLRATARRDVDAELERSEGYRIRVTGDSAVCMAPGEEDGIHLVRNQGRWSVALRETMGLPSQKAESEGQLYAALAKLVASKMDRIGADGVTPETLDREMGAAIQPLIEAAER